LKQKKLKFLATLFVLFALGLSLKAQEDFLGAADFVIGNVTVAQKNKKAVKLKKGFIFRGGETVLTASGSQAKIKLKNGSMVQVLPSSQVIFNEVKFDNGNNRYAFGVIQGGMSSNVNRLGTQDYYKVYTPTAVAGVRGTEFLVAVGVNGNSNVMVKEGAVSIDGTEKKDMVKAGEKAEITLDDDFDKEKTKNSDPNKEFNEFMKANAEINKPAETVEQAADKMKEIEENNATRLQELSKKEKLTQKEEEEIDFLHQRSVNQSAGLYNLSNNIFKKHKNNSLVKRKFYEVQKRLSSIESQIADMDAFIEKMSKEIDDFTDAVSSDIDDLGKDFFKKTKK